MIRSEIFVSYSHLDREIVDRLLVHLKALSRLGSVTTWDDRRIEAGTDWRAELERTIREAAVAVLVVSPDSLVSDFINDTEVPRLLERYAGGGFFLIPLIARPSIWSEVPWLRKFQAWPRGGKSLSELSAPDRERELTELTREIATILDLVQGREVAAPRVGQEPPEGADFFISHDRSDGDFAELLTLRLEKEGLKSWVDVDRLTVGLDWRQEIDQAIRKSRAVIVLVTPEARKSEYVTYEWAFAIGVGIPVVPVLLQETHLHPRLEALQYLDFTNRAARPWTKLFGHLRSLRQTQTP